MNKTVDLKNNKYFHYQACGLSNVWLADGFAVRETVKGKVFHIDHIQDLHKAIGLSLVEKECLLSPDEFRFLRTELRFSRASLGDLLNCSLETIKKWESGANPIPKPSDACLRSLYMHNMFNEEVGDLITRINNIEKEEAKICLSKTSQGWRKCG